MTDDKKPSETLIKFPCDFTIKVFGLAADDFKSAVFNLIQKELPDFKKSAIDERLSENGKYCALNVTVHVTSKAQLDNIYRALSADKKIIMTL